MKDFIYSARWCELLFENRNKNYGAYVIRMREADNTLIAWAFSTSGVLALIGLIMWVGGPTKEMIEKYTDKTPPKQIIYEVQPPAVMPPAGHVMPPSTGSSAASVPVVVDKKINDDKRPLVPIVPIVNGPGTLPFTGEPIQGGPGLGGPEIIPPNANAKNIVEVMPHFPGGEEALLKYLQSNIKYPRELLEQNVMGIVYLGFVIGSDGKVYDMKVLKGVKNGNALADEAMRVVGNMPEWSPGKQGGQNVAVNFVLPVNFVAK